VILDSRITQQPKRNAAPDLKIEIYNIKSTINIIYNEENVFCFKDFMFLSLTFCGHGICFISKFLQLNYLLIKYFCLKFIYFYPHSILVYLLASYSCSHHALWSQT
jgi:hypothetical protein